MNIRNISFDGVSFVNYYGLVKLLGSPDNARTVFLRLLNSQAQRSEPSGYFFVDCPVAVKQNYFQFTKYGLIKVNFGSHVRKWWKDVAGHAPSYVTLSNLQLCGFFRITSLAGLYNSAYLIPSETHYANGIKIKDSEIGAYVISKKQIVENLAQGSFYLQDPVRHIDDAEEHTKWHLFFSEEDVQAECKYLSNFVELAFCKLSTDLTYENGRISNPIISSESIMPLDGEFSISKDQLARIIAAEMEMIISQDWNNYSSASQVYDSLPERFENCKFIKRGTVEKYIGRACETLVKRTQGDELSEASQARYQSIPLTEGAKLPSHKLMAQTAIAYAEYIVQNSQGKYTSVADVSDYIEARYYNANGLSVHLLDKYKR